MDKIDTDTSKLIESSNLMNDQISKYNEYIKNYFESIKKIGVDNSAWVGDVADNFVSTTYSKKDEYEEFGEKLEDFSDLILNCANTLDSSIKSIETGDESK